MPTNPFPFTSPAGVPLAARLDLPEGPVLAHAIFAHCFTCSKDSLAARRISARLAQMGIGVLRFDFTGLGQSGGDFAETSFSGNAADLVAAARAMAGQNMAPDILIGHSLGGAAVLMAAQAIPSARAVVTLGAPFDPEHITENFTDTLAHIQEHGAGEVCLGGRPFTMSKEFVDDVMGADLSDHIRDLKKALLVMHAPMDDVVAIDNASRIFTTAKHPKSFVTLDKADHLITRTEDAEYAADVIAAWAGRYLDLAPPAPPIGTPEGIVRVSEADPNGFLQDINAGPYHHARADEPRAYGGTNMGMSPYGFMAAGLGACTSMTIRMYARRKKWPLVHVSVDVTHDKVHAQDASLPPGATPTAKIDQFTRDIRLVGDLDAAQRARLLEIADKCPVHKTLESGAAVRTRLVPDPAPK